MAASFIADFSGDLVALNSSTATLLYTAGPRASASEPEVVVFQNNTAVVQTVGASDVDDEVNGFVLAASLNAWCAISFRSPGDTAYGFAASGTDDIMVIRT